ncbi:MAG: hypothetical protein B7Y71_00410 [Xanthobacter sp. 35-67-6]|nr:MAG: hypothetical protein B7Y71_00410 [Xanthobacter sp. 35-67-6]
MGAHNIAWGQTVQVEESVYLAAPDGPRRSLQLVVAAALPEAPRLLWTLVRTREGEEPRGHGRGSRRSG